MLVHQYSGLPALALPHGALHLPPSLLRHIERFEKVLLWMADDAPGQDAASAFARKIGLSRCHNVRCGGGARDAVDLIASVRKPVRDSVGGDKFLEAFRSASPFAHEQITDFSELRAEVYNEFANAEGYRGLKSPSFPTLTRVLKGFRRGELTVVTGPTGVGKTSFLSQLSLDYCQQSVPTLWGSFEIKNSRLAKKMISQYGQQDFTSNLKDFEQTADDFEQLPLYFLRFFGMTDVNDVIDAMDYAVYVYDVQHILLDNLQFMMGMSTGGFRTKFDAQDYALDMFRRFSTKNNVHVTLVIHPRKELDRTALGISSVFGTAKATQEADNVIILQRPEAFEKSTKFTSNPDIDFRVMDIKKNRFDGELGSIPYKFNRDILTMVELNDRERISIGLQAVDDEFPDPLAAVAHNPWSTGYDDIDKELEEQEKDDFGPFDEFIAK